MERAIKKMADYHFEKFHLLVLYIDSCRKQGNPRWKDFQRAANDHFDKYEYYVSKL